MIQDIDVKRGTLCVFTKYLRLNTFDTPHCKLDYVDVILFQSLQYQG